MADLINNFYVNQPRELLDSISSISSGVHPCTTNSACSTPKINPLVIPHISESEIENAIRLMPMHKAAGADSLSAKILKISASAISSPLARIINYCIDNSCFPSAWKLAKVIPIYKGKGSTSDMINYRPISLFPLLSKIFERHIHTALYNHLNGNNFLYNLQSGFRKTYLTETAHSRLTRHCNITLIQRLTRHCNINLVCPRYKRDTEAGSTFQVSGTKLWNTLPVNIRKKESYNSFYRAIRTYYYTR